MNTKSVKKIVNKIIKMDKEELGRYAVVVSLSSIDNRARKFLNKAIELRYDDLEDKVSPIVVTSNIGADENE